MGHQFILHLTRSFANRVKATIVNLLARRDIRTTRLLRAILFGLLLRIGTSLTHVLTLALVLPALGSERFGILAAASSLATWISLSNLGLGIGLTTQLSNRKPESCPKAIATSAFFLLSFVGLVVLLLTFALVHVFPFGNFLKVSSTELIDDANVALRIVAIFSALTMVLNIGGPILNGNQRGDVASLSALTGSLAGCSIIFLAATARVSFATMCTVMSASLLLPALIQCIAAYHSGFLSLSRRYFSFKLATESAKLGAAYFLIQLASGLFLQSGPLLVAHYFSASYAAKYDVACRALIIVYAFISAMMVPLWPAVGDAIAKKDGQWLKAAFRRSFFVVTFAWACFAVGYLIFANTEWSNSASRYIPSAPLSVAIIVQGYINSVYNILTTFLSAARSLRVLLISNFVQLVLFFTFVTLLVPTLGPIGIPVLQFSLMASIGIPLAIFATRQLFHTTIAS